ncbi:hypothetical protein [Pseudomonas amygdali]|nr:hypothetical protein [Pseudomonas amygdali]
MLLRIQKDESLRSYVERNRFVPGTNLEINTSKTLSHCHMDSSAVRKIADILGWQGCYGFNKLLHEHTKSPSRYVFKSKFDYSYSGFDYLNGHCFDSLTRNRPYCPVCAKEDKIKLGYSYWRRIHHDVSVCPKHNVTLLTICQFCNKPFARGGHAVNVMWSGCGGRDLADAQPVPNTDAMALRHAKFFDEVCALEHHIYVETATVVLEARIKILAADGKLELLTNRPFESFRRYVDLREEKGDYEVRGFYDRGDGLLALVATVYETFGEFLVDCLTLEPDSPNIDSFWNTYSWPASYTEHFVQEDYSQGVAIWFWPHLENWKRHPFLTYLVRQRRDQRYYKCCNPAYSHFIDYLPGEYHYSLIPPAVPREKTAEIVTKTSWTTFLNESTGRPHS